MLLQNNEEINKNEAGVGPVFVKEEIGNWILAKTDHFFLEENLFKSSSFHN